MREVPTSQYKALFPTLAKVLTCSNNPSVIKVEPNEAKRVIKSWKFPVIKTCIDLPIPNSEAAGGNQSTKIIKGAYKKISLKIEALKVVDDLLSQRLRSSKKGSNNKNG